jgi:outer membrane receptor for ferric coprogen and ferric-rhodotorulic acid
MPRRYDNTSPKIFPLNALSKQIKIASFLLLICGGLAPATAIAETGQQSKSTYKTKVVEEVVVQGRYVVNDRLDTATGLGLTLQETPQSVSIMTFQRIEDQDLRTLTDVVNNSAGVSAKVVDSSRDRYSARGFDINSYQIDGVPIAWSPGYNAGETQTSTVMFERVEIVRGATGLLTGAGNPSASINLVRKHADNKEFTGYVSVEASRWNNYGATADLSAGLNDSGSVRGRVVANYEEGDSFVDYLGDKTSLFYAVIDADLTENTLLRAGVSYQKNDPEGTQWGGLPTLYADGTRADWDRSKTTAPKWSYWASENESVFINLVHEFDNDWEATLNLNHDKNTADLRLLYLYGIPDKVTGLGMGGSPYRSNTSSEQTSINLQVSGDFNFFDRQHELVFGATNSMLEFENHGYSRSDNAAVGDFNQWDGSYPEPTWSSTGLTRDKVTKQKGYYASTRLSLTDSLNVILGGRVADWEQKEKFTNRDYGDSGVFIPYAGALYTFNDTHTVYTSFTEIFQPQDKRNRTGDYLDPLTGKSYEVGLKSTFFDDALHTTVAMFKTDQDNLAQADIDFFVPGTAPPEQAQRAAQGTESEGFEFEVVGEPIEGWNVSFSYTQFTAEDAEGEEVNTDQPRQLLKLFTTYNFSGDLNKLTMGGGVNWEGSNYTRIINPVTAAPQKLEQESYVLVNFMARYDLDDQLSMQLNVDNLFDKTYYSQIGFFGQLAYGEPRNISLNLKYQF